MSGVKNHAVPRKRFGQHFLADPGVADKMIRAFAPEQGQTVIEIGPGTGALTEKLLDHVDRLTVIELDRDLAGLLKDKFDRSRLTVIQRDILTLDFKKLPPGCGPDKKIRVIGNLPYNISTPLLFHLIQFTDDISDMMFMLQKEVALRLSARPGENGYGRLTVTSNLALQCRCLFDVRPDSFRPPPKVNSTVLTLAPRRFVAPIENRHRLHDIIRRAFSHRRKTLRNSLKHLVTESQFQSADIDPGLRAETLSTDQFIRLSNA